MTTFESQAKERFQAYFKEQEPLAKHLNFRIGGPAKFFIEARSIQDIVDAVTLAKQFALPFFVFGGGSNILMSDSGYRGLAIKAANRAMRIEDDRVIAEAGVISATIARSSADKGLRGFEWAISLPGTIGGAVRGNAGCFGGETKDAVESVKLLRDGEIDDIVGTELGFGYRSSKLKEDGNDDIVLEVTLHLTSGDRVEALKKIDETLAKRKTSQPLGSSSAGCMFTNVEYTNDEEIAGLRSLDIPSAMLDRQRIAAGWIIDKLGLKNSAIGDAQVSDQHGNFVLNKGHATAKDIADLVHEIKAEVLARTGVQLHEEVKMIGF